MRDERHPLITGSIRVIREVKRNDQRLLVVAGWDDQQLGYYMTVSDADSHRQVLYEHWREPEPFPKSTDVFRDRLERMDISIPSRFFRSLEAMAHAAEARPQNADPRHPADPVRRRA